MSDRKEPVLFTDAVIKALKPGSKRQIFGKKGDQSLGVRISPNGTKTFVYLYRFGNSPSGKGKLSRMLTLGQYPAMSVADANKAHADAVALLQKGIDPGAVAATEKDLERNDPTVKAFAAEYITNYGIVNKKSWAEDKRILDKDVVPVIGRKKLREVTKRDLVLIIDAVKGRAPVMANRTLACVRKMFNFAVNQALLDISPCYGLTMPVKEVSRDRYLSEVEIKQMWESLGQLTIDKNIVNVLKMLLVTGQRENEVVACRWSEIDLDTCVWCIPKERSKNGMAHEVPLTMMALEILKQQAGLDPVWVFPGKIAGRPLVGTSITQALRKNLDKLGLEKFTPHDLRRSLVTHMAKMGITRDIQNMVTNHADRSIADTYDRHLYFPQKKASLLKWDEKLQSILNEDSKGKIIQMY